jgi:hypothetical protein
MCVSLAAGTRHHIGLLSALVVTAVVWRGALAIGLTGDDVVYIARAAGLEPTPLSFRPLSAVVAWRTEYAAFHLNPLGYHVVSLTLHALNVLALYLVAIRLGAGVGAASSTAILFGVSGIAFTALHAASTIGDLLALLLLLAAARIHLDARSRVDAPAPWVAAALASLAVLAKETALAWPLVIMGTEWWGGLPPPTFRNGTAAPRWRAIVPALASGLLGAAWMAVTFRSGTTSHTGAYAISWAPPHLVTNLSTYARWIVQIGASIRDWNAAPDPGALAVGVSVIVLVAMVWRLDRKDSPLVRVGSMWLLGFLLPVLPLLHHTYLYYLYVPWAGGALAAVGSFVWLTASTPPRAVKFAAVALVAGFVIAEAGGIRNRERATIAHLPADHTIREAELLRHVLSDLTRQNLPAGTVVGFVNPAPAPGVSLATGSTAAPVRDEVIRSYYPLESVLQSGRTLRVFLPKIGYAGFSDTIPSSWGNVEVFLFEQRGYLRRWGSGTEALQHEAEWLRERRSPDDDSLPRTP